MNSTSTVEVATQAVSPPPSDWPKAAAGPSESAPAVVAETHRSKRLPMSCPSSG